MTSFKQTALGVAMLIAVGLAVPEVPVFEDVSEEVGFLQEPLMEKNFGNCMADLNRDGRMELMGSNHHNGTEVYWPQEDGTYRFDDTMYHANESPPPFYKHPANQHGFAAGDLDGDGDYDFVGAINERFRDPVDNRVKVTPPYVGEVEGDAFTLDGSGITGLRELRMYGRTVRLIDMTGNGKLDVLMLNNVRQGLKHFVYFNEGNGNFVKEDDTGIEFALGAYGGLLDANKDGMVDIILTAVRKSELYISERKWVDGQYRPGWRLDTTSMPQLENVKAGHAVLEIDYNGDGLMDVYIATGFQQGPIAGANDILLERKWDGSYIDVSESANIPKLGAHLSVTGADFNNDGHQDIMVGRVPMEGNTRVPELLLLNNGDKTFQQIELPPPSYTVVPGEVVDSVQAIDYNKDGLIDMLIGNANGMWRLLKNVGSYSGNYIQLEVGKHIKSRFDPAFNKETLGAEVTVWAGGKKFVNRIGSRGESHSQSYIELIHVGLGAIDNVQRVAVKFPGGKGQWKRNGLNINGKPVRVGLQLDWHLINRA